MRRARLAIVLAGITLSGCSSFRDVFTSHAETAARVGSHELKSANVADIIVRVGGPQANPQATEVVTGIWVDLALFADRVARGTLKPDSALIARLLWPQLAQTRSSAWHDSIIARRSGVTPAMVDSAYNADGVRAFQHILFTTTGSKAADTAKTKALADKVLPQARSGNFGKLAAQYSADGSKKTGGYLPVWPRGATVPEFDSVAWRLKPGEVSGVVKSQFGFHIIRRPPVAEVHDSMVSYLKGAQTAKLDSAYFAELDVKNKITVNSGAPAAMRSALSDPQAAASSKKELVSFRDGAFTVSDFVRWISALGQPQLQQIRQANDTMLTAFAKNLAQNTVLLREADSAKVAVPAPVFEGLSQQYRALFADLRVAVGLDGPEFSDSSKVSVDERVKLAGKKVDEYFDKLKNGQAQFRQVPPTLSADLRTGGDFKIYQAGIAKAQEIIVAKRRADSASGKSGQPAAPPGTLQPAPGGPPTPTKKP